MRFNPRKIKWAQIGVSALVLIFLFKKNHFNPQNILDGMWNPKLIGLFFVLTFIQLLLGSLRTCQLLPPDEKSKVDLANVLKISWASSMVANIAPSSVVGDAYRIHELKRLNPDKSIDNPIHASLISKVFSFIGLILISDISYLCFGGARKFQEMILAVNMVFVLAIPLLLLQRWVLPRLGAMLGKGTESGFKGLLSKRVTHLTNYLEHYGRNKWALFSAFGLSLVIQLLNVASFALIIYFMHQDLGARLFDVIFVIPIGILCSLLPVSLSGLGIGHLAFAKLLAEENVLNGADVFTVFFIFSFFFNLLGLLPFIQLLKKNGEDGAHIPKRRAMTR